MNVTIENSVATETGVQVDPNMQTRHNASFLLVRNGIPLTDTAMTLSPEVHGAYAYQYDGENYITTYTMPDGTFTYEQVLAGDYSVFTAKTGYDLEITEETDADGNVIIHVRYLYRPSNFDLDFDVVVKGSGENGAITEADRQVMPMAAVLRVTYWGIDDQGNLGWQIIEQQQGGVPGSVVIIDKETGMGSGFCSVPTNWSGSEEPYRYRVAVESYILPDGTLVPAVSGDQIVYTTSGTDLYTGVVSIEPQGVVPAYPEEGTDLSGTGYVKPTADVVDRMDDQDSLPVVTITMHPHTVTFHAQGGTLNGSEVVVLENQYKYPNLNSYKPVKDDVAFGGWYLDAACTQYAPNQSGQVLDRDMVYYALWCPPITIQGTVTIYDTYEVAGQTYSVGDDRAEDALVVLYRDIGGNYVAVDSYPISFTYEDGQASADYSFLDVANDGSLYKVEVQVLNYSSLYDNEAAPSLDGVYTAEEYLAVLNGDDVAVVNAELRFDPETFWLELKVDATQISESFRPTAADTQLLRRDLGKTWAYDTVEGSNALVNLYQGVGNHSHEVWKWHTDGTPLEYQMEVPTVYGNVAGVYEPAGTAYDPAGAPYTIVYGKSSHWDEASQGATQVLTATLVPNRYEIIFDMNAGDDAIGGMDAYITEGADGQAYYAHAHVWSFGDELTAVPYRDGYVFAGWELQDAESLENAVVVTDPGTITVAPGLAQNVTLVAKWEKLKESSYVVRYLEKGSDTVLHTEKIVEVSGTGTIVEEDLLQHAVEIPGYSVDSVTPESLTVNMDDPSQNVVTIYYRPDRYTEPVENNLHIDKQAVLEDDGTYTITLYNYATDDPITSLIVQNTPLDIVLVVEGSDNISSTELTAMKASIISFIQQVAEHGRANGVEHRIALVGYADAGTTGFYDSGAQFRTYGTTGYTYTEVGDQLSDGCYVNMDGSYVLLTHHDSYYHAIDSAAALTAFEGSETVYGQNENGFVALTYNKGLWTYTVDDTVYVYGLDTFFTNHEDVWTFLDGNGIRQIYVHNGRAVYERTANTSGTGAYVDALMPVALGANGLGGVNPSLPASVAQLTNGGAARADLGMTAANNILSANYVADGERLQAVVVFADSAPGTTSSTYSQTVADAALVQAYEIKNRGGYIYTVSPEGSTSDTTPKAMFLNALSSNYLKVQSMDALQTEGYAVTTDSRLTTDGGPYYVKHSDGAYYELKRGSWLGFITYWYYEPASGSDQTISYTSNPTVSDGKVEDYTIYEKGSVAGYLEPDNTGYYQSAADSSLSTCAANVATDITTKSVTEIHLSTDTVLRDVLGRGLVLTENSVITVSTQAGTYVSGGEPTWGAIDRQVTLALANGTESAASGLLNVSVTNYGAVNPTDPYAAGYAPHQVDVTGYDYINDYIKEGHNGKRLVVEISGVEATNDVPWGRATVTNQSESGIWMVENGVEEQFLAFEQPTTIFIQRSYVLDYAKEFALSGWFYDESAGGKVLHVDSSIENGMNQFAQANTASGSFTDADGTVTAYGNAAITDGVLSYQPKTMCWGGYDQFYVFGTTQRTAATSQDANANGNLWSKVTVIPANTVYYEDSFLTDGANGIEGFTFTGAWEVVTSGTPDTNTEVPEHQEHPDYGDVHGWIDSMADDTTWTDGSAHGTGLNGERGAMVNFTFTGTGVDVYTHTSIRSGIAFATLYRVTDGSAVFQKSLIMDNLSVSNGAAGYYHIPTVGFHGLEHGTYKVQILATRANAVEGFDTGSEFRGEYYVDGIRVYTPMGIDQTAADNVVKNAYGMELNPVYTSIRDILLDSGSFTADKDVGTGAVFVDWIGEDPANTGVSVYDVGTFETYGPKGEVYLAPGQSIVLKVDPNNTYYVGMKSLTGDKTQVEGSVTVGGDVTAVVSGIGTAGASKLTISHAADLYYQVTPEDGYIIIGNNEGSQGILSLTKLCTTNPNGPVDGGGVVDIQSAEAVMAMSAFSLRLSAPKPEPPQEPEEQLPTEADLTAAVLFADIRQWLAE